MLRRESRRAMKVVRPAFLCIVALFCGACAVAPEYQPSDFVGKGALPAVAFAREGATLLAQGRTIEAELSLRKALHLEPQAENIRLNLAVALEGNGQFSEAREILEGILRRHGESPALLERFARLSAAEGNYKEALRVAERAFDLYEQGEQSAKAANLARALAQIGTQLGDEERAICYSALHQERNDTEGARIFAAGQALLWGNYSAVLGYLQRNREAVPFPEFDEEATRLTVLARYGLGQRTEAVRGAMQKLDRGGISGQVAEELQSVALFGAHAGDGSKVSDDKLSEWGGTVTERMEKGLEIRRPDWPPALLADAAKFVVEGNELH